MNIAADKKELKTKLKKLSQLCFGLSVSTYAVTYLFFHYVTCDGFTPVKQLVAGKPFVTNMLGVLGTDFLFASIFCAVFGKTVVTD